MAILDTIGVTATSTYKEEVLMNVFRYTGSATESTTEMQMTVITNGASIVQNVRFRRGGDGVFIHGYDIAIPAGRRIFGFEFKEIGSSTLTSTVSLVGDEVKVFDEAGILYIDEIRFRLNVSLI